MPAMPLPSVSGSPGLNWDQAVEGIWHGFQPIVHMRTGRCHGYEALVRGWDALGFDSPQSFFNAAHADGALTGVETRLMDKATATFKRLVGTAAAKLFLNVDPRLEGAVPLVTAIGQRYGVPIVHEISELDTTAVGERLEAAVEQYRRRDIGIALDDFGVGFGGMKLLYEAQPAYVKIDRFFIAGIDRDLRKRAIVRALVSYAQTQGVKTIAEGVETAAEFYVCRDAGCDFAQGFLLGRPQTYSDTLPFLNDVVLQLNQQDRRAPAMARQRLSELLERIPPININAPRSLLLELFAHPSTPSTLPVVGKNGAPRGLIRERDLKPFIYSRYGTDLLRNKVAGSRLDEFVVPCAVCDIGTPIDRVIEAFSEDSDADGVIIVEGGEYAGFLSSRSLLKLVNERRLAAAADQNPLTRLPGNNAISEVIEGALADLARPHCLAYIDFDNFKPFNDHFGFRQGDRAILMFSDRLKVLASRHGGFAGHIGGDDFVLVLTGVEEAAALADVETLLSVFRLDAESLYPMDLRHQGWFEGKDRDGHARRFPLLTASAVVLFLAPGRNEGMSVDHVVRLVAGHKSAAKAHPSRIVCARV